MSSLLSVMVFCVIGEGFSVAVPNMLFRIRGIVDLFEGISFVF